MAQEPARQRRRRRDHRRRRRRPEPQLPLPSGATTTRARPASPAARPTAAPRPASEPETRALDGLMRRISFEFLVNYHSAAELLLYGVGLAGRHADPGRPDVRGAGRRRRHTRPSPATTRTSRPSCTPPTARPPSTRTTPTARSRSPRRCPPARPRARPTRTTSSTRRLRERVQLPRLRGADPGRVREEHPVRAGRREVRARIPIESGLGGGPHGPGLRGGQLRRLLRRSAAGGRHRAPRHART